MSDVLAAFAQMMEANGSNNKDDYVLVTPVNFKQRKLGYLLGVDVIVDPLMPEDEWMIQLRRFVRREG